jgi:hypothetical protein
LKLSAAPNLIVPQDVLQKTREYLRLSKKHQVEVILLWSAGKEDSHTKHVKKVWLPRQLSAEAYFEIPSEELFELNKELFKTRQVLVAQVHTHPTKAFHSETDDEYALVDHVGGYSIVVPDFGTVAPSDFEKCAYFVREPHAWRELSTQEARWKIQFEGSKESEQC